MIYSERYMVNARSSRLMDGDYCLKVFLFYYIEINGCKVTIKWNAYHFFFVLFLSANNIWQRSLISEFREMESGDRKSKVLGIN